MSGGVFERRRDFARWRLRWRPLYRRSRCCPHSLKKAQGPQRMARGRGYFAYLQSRHPGDLNQSLHIVPGVGHNGDVMLSSPCALHAMFGTGECAD